ncbi:MAG TPA: glycosyl hydrolase [Chloroflexota bacterium]
MARALTLLLAGSLLAIGSGSSSPLDSDGTWSETRFHTGCDPGPYDPPPPPEHLETRFPPLGTVATPATLAVDLGEAANTFTRPILGTGFNFEHALWSCPEFRGVFRTEILEPFRPAIARVDTGLLPAAPPELPAASLRPDVYTSVLDSAPYANSWAFMRRLNRAGVKIVLGVWGGPDQFTDDGTRRGLLLPRHYDDYVEYVATVVDYLVRRQQIQVWATTIANEPDGGDGNAIPPSGLAYIAHQLAPRVAADGVKLYGPDTSNGTAALKYIPLLLDDPQIADNLAFVAFHQYYPSSEVDSVLDVVRARRPDLPVIVTEYTSFNFGDLDAGQEANAQNGFGLDIAATLLSHYARGVDAAVYWDAIDYLQPGHTAVTRWGLLRGPSDDFARRQRYYALLQILPYLQPGAQVVYSRQSGGDRLQSLAIRTADGQPAVFMVNQDFSPLDVRLSLSGSDASQYRELTVTRTERGRTAQPVGRLRLSDNIGELTIPPRSVTTLFPAGADTAPEAGAAF